MCSFPFLHSTQAGQEPAHHHHPPQDRRHLRRPSIHAKRGPARAGAGVHARAPGDARVPLRDDGGAVPQPAVRHRGDAGPGPPPGPVYNLALHILHALCKLDYAPSVLTVTRIALVSRKIDQPQWAPAVERFERLVKSLTAYRPSSSSSKSKKAKGNNSGEAETTRIEEVEEEASLRANAFTLKGLIIVASNQARPKPSPEGYREALKYFESAVGSSSNRSRFNSSSSPASSFFDWQISCMVEMGHCYAALGDHPKAHAAWKFAAEELDDKDATALYAVHALQQDDPAREALLVKAAVSESELAVAELNRIYSDNLRDQQDKGEGEEIKKQGEAKWDTLFKKVARSEWEKLSSPPATTGTK
ncbi:hypothetical protein PG989_001576 [Apiospora arundinis]